jgi:hypothetical protein
MNIRRAVFFCIHLVAVLCLSNNVARAAEADISKAFDGLAFPESPAFTMLGVTPAIIRPASPHALTMSFMEGIDVNGNLQDAVAVDMAPYLLFFGKELSLKQYQDSRREQDLSRIQLSLAFSKGSGDTDNARRLAAAMHWTIWDDGDLRLDKDLIACVARAQQGSPASYPSGTASGPPEAGQTSPSQIDAAAGSRPTMCLAESLKRNWNKSAMDVGIAPAWIDRNGRGDSLGWDGLGLWTSLSYGFDRYESLRDNSQIVLHARYQMDEAEPAGQNQYLHFLEHDTFSLGAKYRYGEPQSTAFLQGLIVQTKPEGQATGRSYLYSVGAEVGIIDNLWFELELGGIGGYRNQGNGGFVTVQLKGAFPEKNATK